MQKGSIALEVTVATKRLTSQHHHMETVQWNTYHNPYLPIQEWEVWKQKPADIKHCEWQLSTKISKAKQSTAEIRNHM